MISRVVDLSVLTDVFCFLLSEPVVEAEKQPEAAADVDPQSETPKQTEAEGELAELA